MRQAHREFDTLAYNKLNVKEDLFLLRPYYFPELRSVSLWGNPMAEVSI